MARCQKVITSTGAVTATLMGGGSASEFYGLSVFNNEAAPFYIKLYWEGTGVAPATTPYGSQPAVTLPSAGTTVSSMTILVPTAGLTLTIQNVPINNGGRIWFWASVTAADTAQSVLPVGSSQITFVYD